MGCEGRNGGLLFHSQRTFQSCYGRHWTDNDKYLVGRDIHFVPLLKVNVLGSTTQILCPPKPMSRALRFVVANATNTPDGCSVNCLSIELFSSKVVRRGIVTFFMPQKRHRRTIAEIAGNFYPTEIAKPAAASMGLCERSCSLAEV